MAGHSSRRFQRKLHDDAENDQPPNARRKVSVINCSVAPQHVLEQSGSGIDSVLPQSELRDDANRPTSPQSRTLARHEHCANCDDDRPVKPPPRKISDPAETEKVSALALPLEYETTQHISNLSVIRRLKSPDVVGERSRSDPHLHPSTLSHLTPEREDELVSADIESISTHHTSNRSVLKNPQELAGSSASSFSSPNSNLFNNSGSNSLASQTDESLSNRTLATADLVIMKRYGMNSGGAFPSESLAQDPTSVARHKMKVRSEIGVSNIPHEWEIPGYLERQPQKTLHYDEQKELAKEYPGKVLVLPNEDISVDDSMSTVPPPPALQAGGHYSQPGAFRMTIGGVTRATDVDSVVSMSTLRTNRGEQVVEASLVEEQVPSDEYGISKSGSHYDYEASTYDVSLYTAPISSPIVSAEPLGEGHAIRECLRSRRLRFGTCFLVLVFVVLTVGTIYGITGFSNIRGLPNESVAPPTPAPTTEGDIGLEYFVQVALPEFTKMSLKRENSPQSKALAWLRNNTHLGSLPLSRRLQRFALATLYFSAGGERGWTDDVGWMSDSPECTWFSASNRDAICNQNEDYLVLSLPLNQMRGTIPPEIGLLTNLDSLELPQNLLTGFVPVTLGEVRTLREIDLFDNYLSGTIPSELGSLSLLEIAHLEFNFLAQHLPDSLGLATSLKMLLFDRNQLVGSLPTEFGALTELEVLHTFGNLISSSIPSEVGYLGALLELRFDANLLTGEIPSEVGLLSNLLELSFGNNTGLAGTIPTEIGNCQQLTYLDFFANKLSGNIPSEIGMLTNLEHLYFEQNMFDGSIPTELGRLTATKQLWLHMNGFTGFLPTQIGRITTLQSLDVSFNSMKGSLPTELTHLRNLTELYLEFNDFTGPIPSELGLLTRLTHLALHGNQFTGSLPEEICRLTIIGELLVGTLSVDCGKVLCSCCICR